MGVKLGPKDFILAIYVYYMLNYFKTTYYIHHPLEIWLQGKKIHDYLRHPVGEEECSSKVCPLGNHVGLLLGFYLIFRYQIKPATRKTANKVIWLSVLFGSLIMNLNVFIYLFPAYLVDRLNLR